VTAARSASTPVITAPAALDQSQRPDRTDRVGDDDVAAQHHRTRSPAHREATVQLMAELYIRAQVAVERGYRRPLTLGTLAQALAVSPRQLERAYDEIGLTTFAAHLRAVRLRNAAELLAHQPLTVTDVARLVGYRQPSHFVKAFRRRFGITPGAFRDAARREAATGPAQADLPRPPAAAGPSPRPDTTTTPGSPAPRGGDRYAPRTASGASAGPTLRRYSNPNSVDELCPDPDDRLRGADDVAAADVVPALAARADDLDDEDAAPGVGAVPDVPPAPSKPNSLPA
jgi:AraC-like DNA-binding protein